MAAMPSFEETSPANLAVPSQHPAIELSLSILYPIAVPPLAFPSRDNSATAP